MTQPVSLFPPIIGAALPGATVPGLSDDEQRLVNGLAAKLSFLAPVMMVRNTYYEGTQRLADLGVSIPPQLAGVRTVVDWPRICVDPLVERCLLDGFRLPTATDVDDELAEHWAANDMDAEAPLAFLDALIYGRGYMIVGSPDTPGDSPVVTVESPLNMTMTWDPRTRMVTAAYQSYEVEGVYRAVLYLPDETVSMSREITGGTWRIDDRDQHNFGQVPVARLANRQRASQREGRSEISPAIMNTTDSACRSLLGMEIAREFYSVPHRYVLGATESDFTDPQGNAKSALEMVMSKMLAFERDEDGQAPTVGQFQAFDPSVFTRIIDSHAQLMSSYTGYPASYFGLTSTANPASADAIRVTENRIDRRGGQVQRQFSPALRGIGQLIWRFAHGGAPLPKELRRLQVDWADVSTPTPAATTDAMFKQSQMGAIPPTSDVTLKRLGWSALERARLAQDRALDAGASVLAELANSMQEKEARADLTVARDINPAAVKAPANPQSPANPANPQQPPSGQSGR